MGDNLHSQLVGWAKIILPLCALALLSTLFLFARGSSEPDIAAFTRAEEIAREQRVTAPEFSGVTNNGDIIVISAKSARPDITRADTVVIDEIRLRLDTPDRTFIEVTAVQGEVDREDCLLVVPTRDVFHPALRLRHLFDDFLQGKSDGFPKRVSLREHGVPPGGAADAACF